MHKKWKTPKAEHTTRECAFCGEPRPTRKHVGLFKGWKRVGAEDYCGTCREEIADFLMQYGNMDLNTLNEIAF